MARRFARNPKFRIEWKLGGSHLRDVLADDGLRWFTGGRFVELAGRLGEPLRWWGAGRPYLRVDLPGRRILVPSDLEDLTQAWVLADIAREMPEWGPFQLHRWLGQLGDSRVIAVDLGVTLGDLAKRLQRVQERAPSRLSDDPRDYDYLVLHRPEERRWFHATPLRNVPSIEKRGLVPSWSEEAGEGWGSFQIYKQPVVYLTHDLVHAVQIAETLMQRLEEDAAVLEVAGAALRGHDLVVDEDALLMDGTLSEGVIDPDFPDWETSSSSPFKSLGVRDTIAPKHVTAGIMLTLDEDGDVSLDGPLLAEYEALARVEEEAWG